MTTTTTVRAFAEVWPVRFARPDPRTNAQHVYMIRPFAETFGDRPLDSLKRAEVYTWACEHPASARYAKQMFNDAINAGLVETNPCLNLRVASSVGRRYVEPPTLEQIVALEAAAPLAIKGMPTVAAFTMLRVSEILAVRDSEIHADAEHPWLDVSEQIARDGRRKPLKGLARPRKAPLPPEAVAALRSALRTPYEPRLWPISYSGQYAAWVETRKAVGLPELHFHDLRHFGANRLLERGVEARDVAYFMGHRDDSEVRKRYGRHVDAEAALERLSASTPATPGDTTTEQSE
jgi:integrase